MRSAVSLFFPNKPFGEKGCFPARKYKITDGPAIIFEEVACTITPLIAKEERISKEGFVKLLKKGTNMDKV